MYHSGRDDRSGRTLAKDRKLCNDEFKESRWACDTAQIPNMEGFPPRLEAGCQERWILISCGLTSPTSLRTSRGLLERHTSLSATFTCHLSRWSSFGK